MIADPQGVNQAFDDQTIQDALDQNRDDVWYEQLDSTPSVVNTASTGNEPLIIWADYYSNFKWLEGDTVVQGYQNGQFWKVITPTTIEPIVGHFRFEENVFTSGTFPGQWPPVYFVGKSYDPYGAAADLLDFRAMSLSLTTFDFSSDGQSFRPSQTIDNIQKMAAQYRRLARPKIAKMIRSDIAPETDAKSVPILGGDGGFGGVY